MTILIPAYEPNEKLILLISELKSNGYNQIVVIDDGSGSAYEKIFSKAEMLGCIVLKHDKNYGKGRALKTGFNYLICTNENGGVICVDSDGQHLVKDILRVENAVINNPEAIVLGTRTFTGHVPFKSRFGNSLTRGIFAFSSGMKIRDTQTGLRGFGPIHFEWLCKMHGERFEYEMNMLLEVARTHENVIQLDIETVYFESNKSTHFRAVRDSLLVYWPIVKFSASSMISGLLDFFLLFLFQAITNNLFISVVAARMCSAIFNFSVNKHLVFKPSNSEQYQKSSIQNSVLKYATLVIIILAMNYEVLHVLNEVMHVPLFFSKILTEVILFVFSYWVQRKFVFNLKKVKIS